MNPLIACRLIMIFAIYFPDIGICPAVCKVLVMISIFTHITLKSASLYVMYSWQLRCLVQPSLSITKRLTIG